MEKLPGMAATVSSSAEQLLDGLFSSGGLFLSQICTVTGVELHTVQNWVKRGFVPPPEQKTYSKKQLCRIATINMLRDVLPLDTALNLLRYINGVLDDESDDRIDDSLLYLKFCRLTHASDDSLVDAIAEVTADIEDAEVRERTATVLEGMYYAYRSTEYKKQAEGLIASALKKGEIAL